MIHVDKYNIFICHTADNCWSYVMNFGGHPTVAYGDVGQDKASWDDVLWAVMLLAWEHSCGGYVEKKYPRLPGLENKTVFKIEDSQNVQKS